MECMYGVVYQQVQGIDYFPRHNAGETDIRMKNRLISQSKQLILVDIAAQNTGGSI